jgi:hypothetical protein
MAKARFFSRAANQLKAMFANMAARGMLKGLQRNAVKQLRNLDPKALAHSLLRSGAKAPTFPTELGSPQAMETMIETLRGKPQRIAQENMIEQYRVWQQNVKKSRVYEGILEGLQTIAGDADIEGASKAEIQALRLRGGKVLIALGKKHKGKGRLMTALSDVPQHHVASVGGVGERYKLPLDEKTLKRLAYRSKSGVRGGAITYEQYMTKGHRQQMFLAQHADILEDLARRAKLDRTAQLLSFRTLSSTPKELAQEELRDFLRRKLHGGIGYIPMAPGGSSILDITRNASGLSVEPTLERALGIATRIAAQKGSRAIHQYQKPIAEKARTVLFGEIGGKGGGLLTPVDNYLQNMQWDTSVRKYVRRQVRKRTLPGMLERSRRFATARRLTMREQVT